MVSKGDRIKRRRFIVMFRKYVKKPFLCRCLVLLCAIFMNGLGMTIMRLSCLGTEPFSCLNYSISERFGISMGLSVAVINSIFLVLDLVFMRKLLGIGTVATIFFMGSAADIWGMFISNMIGDVEMFQGMEHILLRLCWLVPGMLIMILSCSFVMSCDLGMAPYDTLGYIVEKYSNRKIPFKWARVFFDCACVLTAYILSCPMGMEWELIGVGTVIMAFCIGPVITFFRKYLTDLCIDRLIK